MKIGIYCKGLVLEQLDLVFWNLVATHQPVCLQQFVAKYLREDSRVYLFLYDLLKSFNSGPWSIVFFWISDVKVA